MKAAGTDRRLRLIALAACLVAVVAAPLAVLASHGFGDVPDSNTFHADIDAIADVGVTTGCGGGNYCPTEFVTREQMAGFLNRLGALGPGKVPVVNADKVDGHDAVLPAETIVIDQIGPWLDGTTGPVFLAAGSFGTLVTRNSAGTGEVYLMLQAPGTIGDVAYGLQSVRICYGTSANVTITLASVTTVVDGDTFTLLAEDGTDRLMSANSCFTVTDDVPQDPGGGVRLKVAFSYTAAGSANMSSVRVTWAPILP